jgi:hypothetical protein
MKKCPNCKKKMKSWNSETPFYKIPYIQSYCTNCGAVLYPEIKGTMKLNNESGGILSFTK